MVFNSFDTDDAWEIGSKIREKITDISAGAVVDITCYGISLFTVCTKGATPHNFTWVARKRNTVMEYWKSSYRVALELMQSNKTFEDRGLERIHYAASGGGFPIRLKTGGVIGAIVVSGMTQEQDHQFIIDAVGDYLGISTPSI